MLHAAWREYDAVAASDDAILGAVGRNIWHKTWYEHNSIRRGLRREFIQHAGYSYVPLSPTPPSSVALLQVVGADETTQVLLAAPLLGTTYLRRL